MRLSLAGVVVLALGGGMAALHEPGLRDGRLTAAGRSVMRTLGNALLDGSLPVDSAQRERALDGLLARLDTLAAALPSHAQAELSQLLATLATAPGRRLLAGLAPDWSQASIPQIQEALQAMRTSGAMLRRQAYHALHELTGAAYFSAPETWAVLGYPGPVPVPAA